MTQGSGFMCIQGSDKAACNNKSTTTINSASLFKGITCKYLLFVKYSALFQLFLIHYTKKIGNSRTVVIVLSGA